MHLSRLEPPQPLLDALQSPRQNRHLLRPELALLDRVPDPVEPLLRKVALVLVRRAAQRPLVLDVGGQEAEFLQFDGEYVGVASAVARLDERAEASLGRAVLRDGVKDVRDALAAVGRRDRRGEVVLGLAAVVDDFVGAVGLCDVLRRAGDGDDVEAGLLLARTEGESVNWWVLFDPCGCSVGAGEKERGAEKEGGGEGERRGHAPSGVAKRRRPL